MCIICTTEDHSTLTYLTSLDCSRCKQIKEIPSTLTNLQELYCNMCPLIKEIPSTLTNLHKLYCNMCPLIKDIPSTLTNLQELYCYNCPLIKDIHSTLTKLRVLDCSDCPNLYYIGIKTKPLYYNLYNTHFGNYNWITHKDRFKYKIAVRKICDFMYKLYIRKQKKRILALQLWCYGLQDVKDLILKKLKK
jgi:hypothetical protein